VEEGGGGGGRQTIKILSLSTVWVKIYFTSISIYYPLSITKPAMC
jgi:hypothetical protein